MRRDPSCNLLPRGESRPGLRMGMRRAFDSRARRPIHSHSPWRCPAVTRPDGRQGRGCDATGGRRFRRPTAEGPGQGPRSRVSFFRQFVAGHAQRLSLTGWVRNLPDRATVEVVAEGPREVLEDMLALLDKGPPGARVEETEAEWSAAWYELTTFEVAHESHELRYDLNLSLRKSLRP